MVKSSECGFESRRDTWAEHFTKISSWLYQRIPFSTIGDTNGIPLNTIGLANGIPFKTQWYIMQYNIAFNTIGSANGIPFNTMVWANGVAFNTIGSANGIPFSTIGDINGIHRGPRDSLALFACLEVWRQMSRLPIKENNSFLLELPHFASSRGWRHNMSNLICLKCPTLLWLSLYCSELNIVYFYLFERTYLEPNKFKEEDTLQKTGSDTSIGELENEHPSGK